MLATASSLIKTVRVLGGALRLRRRCYSAAVMARSAQRHGHGDCTLSGSGQHQQPDQERSDQSNHRTTLPQDFTGLAHRARVHAGLRPVALSRCAATPNSSPPPPNEFKVSLGRLRLALEHAQPAQEIACDLRNCDRVAAPCGRATASACPRGRGSHGAGCRRKHHRAVRPAGRSAKKRGVQPCVAHLRKCASRPECGSIVNTSMLSQPRLLA
jgi:hypothetical protein